MYLRALKTVRNLKISYGHFLTHSCHMVLTGSNPPKKVWVDKTEEKGSDVNIASHLLRDGFGLPPFYVPVLMIQRSRIFLDTEL